MYSVPSRYRAPQPRLRPIEIDQPFMRGRAHFVLRLPELTDTQHALKLISGNQLVVSSSGLEAAFVSTDASGKSHVVHTTAGVLGMPFVCADVVGRECFPRILYVDERSALVWGLAEGRSHPSLWHLSSEQIFPVAPVGRLQAVHGNREGIVLTGDSAHTPGERVLVTSSGILPVEPGAQVTVANGGDALVLERYTGDPFHYAYRFTRTGEIHDFIYAPCAADEVPVQLLHWGGRFFLAVRSPKGSYLREFGLVGEGELLGSELDGKIEMAWSAPGGRSIALMTSVRTRKGVVRRLHLNGDIVHEGRFSMDKSGLHWSDTGQSFVAVVQETDSRREVIVGPKVKRPIPRGQHVREVLVSDSGLIDALILTDGCFDYPFVGLRPHDRVPYAWNLHRTLDGSVAYNSFHDHHLMCWMDWTDRE